MICGKTVPVGVSALIGLSVTAIWLVNWKNVVTDNPSTVATLGVKGKGHLVGNERHVAGDLISRVPGGAVSRVTSRSSGCGDLLCKSSELPRLPDGFPLTLDDLIDFAAEYDACGEDLIQKIMCAEQLFKKIELPDLLVLIQYGINGSNRRYQIAGLKTLRAALVYDTNGNAEGGESNLVALTERDKSAIQDILTAAVDNPESEIRELGVRSAFELPEEIQTVFLASAVLNENVDVRQWILDAIKDSEIVSDDVLLCQMLDDQNPKIKQQASERLHDKFGVSFSTTEEALKWWEDFSRVDDEKSHAAVDGNENEEMVAEEAEPKEL